MNVHRVVGLAFLYLIWLANAGLALALIFAPRRVIRMLTRPRKETPSLLLPVGVFVSANVVFGVIAAVLASQFYHGLRSMGFP